MANTTGQKFGGRKLGTSNKDITTIRTTFQLLVENNIESLQKDLDNLKPIDRIKMIIDLAKFVIPTLKAVEMESEVTQRQREPITFRVIKDTIQELESKY